MYSFMAIKLLTLLSFLLIASIGHAKRNIPSDTNTSHFDFIKKLEGLHKGNNTKGIHQLKTYLERFGYLENLHETQTNNDDFDDILESAIKTYQKNYNLKPTGIIDAITVSKMTVARCGVPDIIKGTNYMQARKTGHNSSNIHTVSQFSFLATSTWPPSKRHLRYAFLGNVPDIAKLPVELAFKRWASVSKFTFAEAGRTETPDLTVGFYSRDHGDGFPFDGTNGALAHAFLPPDGRLHYNIDFKWFYLFRSSDAYDLWTTALHEIGHLLGLQHTSVEGAVMFPTSNPGETKDLTKDDIQQLVGLYGL